MILTCKMCGNEFYSKHKFRSYCSDECRQEGFVISQKDAWLNRRCAKRKAPPSKSISDVIAFANEYKKTHGRYISYGKAVLLMEKKEGARK